MKPPASKTREIWKGTADFVPGYASYSQDGESLANDFTNKLKADGFFAGCVTVEPKDLPAMPSAVVHTGTAPASKVTGSGALSVTTVAYLPWRKLQAEAEAKAAEQRSKEGPNTAVNRMNDTKTDVSGPERDRLQGGLTRYSPSVEEYLRSELAAELRAMGFDTADARRTISAEIEDGQVYGMQWGWSASARIRFSVVEGTAGRTLFTAVKEGRSARYPVPMIEADALTQAIRAGTEALVQDPDFVKALK